MSAFSERGEVPQAASWQAFLSYAFRPLYLLAAAQGALFALLWGLNIGGTAALPGFLWHGHEMVWGYAGAVIVGFLLTAVATWTGQPPLGGRPLGVLVLLWLGARVLLSVLPQSVWPGGLLSVAFFLAAAVLFARPILHSQNRRNLFPVLLLLAFAGTDALFLLAVAGHLALDLRGILHAGLLIVAVLIFMMGSRVIPFFTARRLRVEQVGNRPALLLAGLALPLLLAIGVACGVREGLPGLLLALIGLAGGLANLVSMLRWWRREVCSEPMLWVLFAGFACTALGVALYGVAWVWTPAWLNAPLHLVAVGGIGTLTLGMMTRTALGHTGRPIAAPAGMVPAFCLMLAATGLRVLSALWPAWHQALVLAAGLCFAAALGIFLWRYAPWLLRPRANQG